MSDFIDEIFFMHPPPPTYHQPTFHSFPSHPKSLPNLTKTQIIKNLLKIIPTLTTDYFLTNYPPPHQNTLELTLSFSNCGLASLYVVMNLKIDLSKKCFQTSVSILQNQTPFKIQSLNKRVLICKLFCKSTPKNLNKITLSLASGQFKLLTPIHYFHDQDFLHYLVSKSKQHNLIHFISKTLQDSMLMFKPLLRQLMEDFQDDSNEKRHQAQETIKRSIYRYIIKSGIEPSFDVSFGSGKYQKMQCLSMQQTFYTNSMAQNIVTDFSEFDSHSLFLTPKVPLKTLRKLYARQYFISNQQQLTILKTKIQPPGNRTNLGMQSKYIYNLIELNQSNKIHLRKINVGGFSQISIGEVEFWYMLSASNRRVVKLEQIKRDSDEPIAVSKVKKQHKKILVFKTNRYPSTQSSRNRISHQIKIASKFKGTPSIFIPEYYTIVNERSPFTQHLIMQYLPYPTLNQYAEIHKNTISFLTKIHIASLIVHALQNLKNNSIVHMDIKPSNIIVAKRIITKLFDFGQSYHKDVCGENYKPAFSNPYGSPQSVIRQGKSQFTEKSDIYSWAVLIWELIFKRYPFYLPLEKTVSVLKNKTHEKRIYYVPEQQNQYGSWEIMPLIRCVLLKAMDKDIKNRPYTIWLAVVLKECLAHLINLQCNSSEE